MRILELIATVFHKVCMEQSGQCVFASKDEGYEFAYLLLFLHTCQHNPSMKDKQPLKIFSTNVRSLCPISKDTLTDEYIQMIHTNITENEFFTPINRSPIRQDYEPQNNASEIDIRVGMIKEEYNTLTVSEFVACTKLTESTKLFHYHNFLEAPKPLINQAQQYLTDMVFKSMIHMITGEAQGEHKIMDILPQILDICREFDKIDHFNKLIQKMASFVNWRKHF